MSSNAFSPDILKKVESLPQRPGVYIFYNISSKIIYIGKAKRLKNRVKSYFQINIDANTKTKILVSNIHKLKYIETTSELEALILEAQLIKKHKPKYNIQLKDDKSYLYIVIRKDEVLCNNKKVKLSKIVVCRETDLKKGDISFGPYTSSKDTRSVVRTIRRFLPYRDCSKSKFLRYQKQMQPCLYGHIGLCSAPCTNNITPQDYEKDINKIKKFLKGDTKQFLTEIHNQMELSSKNQDYEQAIKYRDMLTKFEYVRTKYTSVQKYIDNPYLVQDLRQKSLNQLVSAIPTLNSLPYRIECYDISNISGTDAVGSMVVALDGDITKSEYRKFKIKSITTPDDFKMMYEVLYRRLKKTQWEFPNLLVVDGGKGQVSAALEVLTKLNLDIPVIGLAKKQETIICFDSERFLEINLSKNNEGLKLLQTLRDEAHRFAQAYHHKLRLKVLNDNN